MQMALDGTQGYCGSTADAIEVVLGKVKWATLEGVGAIFLMLAVGSISLGAFIFTWMVTKTFSRYADPTSKQYVFSPWTLACASGLLACLISLSFLHHLQTITDTIAFC